VIIDLSAANAGLPNLPPTHDDNAPAFLPEAERQTMHGRYQAIPFVPKHLKTKALRTALNIVNSMKIEKIHLPLCLSMVYRKIRPEHRPRRGGKRGFICRKNRFRHPKPIENWSRTDLFMSL
jgi:hypothetical protein